MIAAQSHPDELIAALVTHRRALGITQAQVAEALGITQPTVAEFESPASDPKLSTVRRYATVVCARIAHEIHLSGDHCHAHNRYEPIPSDAYRVCGECGHCFVTAAELVRKDAEMRASVAAPGEVIHDLPADQIYICPECTHDF